MLKLIWSLMKIACITVIVLIGSHLVKVRGRTVSDQIKIGMAHTETVIDSARRSFGDSPAGKKASGEFLNSERQKLKDLIRDLNR